MNIHITTKSAPNINPDDLLSEIRSKYHTLFLE